MIRKLNLALAVLVSLGVAQAASAQTYPSKPIRIIVPFAAGGANDLSARAIQQPLAKDPRRHGDRRERAGRFDQDRDRAGRQGAARRPHADARRPSCADGLLLFRRRRGEVLAQDDDPRPDRPVSVGHAEARADAPFKNWQELVAYAKKNPGKLNVGGPAPGGMMNMIVLETAKAAGINVTYVPYKGGGPSGLALLGGQVDYRVAQPSEVHPNVKAGKTRALAVAGPQRMDEMPDVPTLRELGIAFDVPPFGFDFWGPANMPSALAQRITSAIEQAVKDPAFVEASKVLVYKPVFTGPDKLQESIRNFESNLGPKMLEMFPPEPKK
jgi:tripartite-type tricarboxylate transporter receptor subunit TctC